MRLTVLLAAVALIGLTAFAPAPFPKKERLETRDDLELMQGTWRMTSYDMSGRPVGHAFKVRIKRNNWTFISTSGAQERESSTYTYNLEYKASPRAFEWRYAQGGDNGWVGSYRLEAQGKKLTIIFDGGTLKTMQTRPTDFNGTPAFKMTLEHVTRD